MNTGPRIDSYEWAARREAMLRFGPDDGPVVVLALPLFEEANRTRAFGVSLLRSLAERGIGGVLPELPGQGESEVPAVEMRLADLRAAFAAVPGTHTVAIRSGALMVDQRKHWLLAPQDGSSLLRELARVKGAPLAGDPVGVAGNVVGRDMLDQLADAFHPGAGRGPGAVSNEGHSTSPDPSQRGPGPRRVGPLGRIVRLAGDRREADRHVDGTALWRRAEPDNDLSLIQTLADDIAQWIATCGA